MPMLITFRPWHMTQFISRETNKVEQAPTEHNGPAFTAIDDDGQILGCSGVTMDILPGIGIAWFAVSQKLIDKYPIWATRSVKNELTRILRDYNLQEVHASVNMIHDEKKYNRWIETLGFNEVGRHVLYERRR